MTLDEYNTAVTKIYIHLKWISDETTQQALAGVANTSNPGFIKIMERQAKLIEILNELNQKMMSPAGVSA